MNRTARAVTFTFVLATIAWVAPLGRPAAQAGYTLVELSGAAGGGPASDIDDSGKVVGYRFSGGGYEWTLANGVQPLAGDAALADLFPIFDYFPKALGIGPTGIIVGKGWGSTAERGGPTGPARWTPLAGYRAFRNPRFIHRRSRRQQCRRNGWTLSWQ